MAECYNFNMDLTDKSFHFSKVRIETLHKLGLYTSEQVLSYYPYRFEILEAKDFDAWQINEKVTFEGEVVSSVSTFRRGRMTSSSFEVQAYEHVFKVWIFNRPWIKGLTLNQKITIQGVYKGGSKIYAIKYDLKPLEEHEKITPVYSTKESIQQRMIRDSIRKVYEALQNEIYDEVPEEFIRKYKLLRKSEALRRIHFPEDQNDVKLAYRTLKYEEFLRFFVSMQMNRNEEGQGAYKIPKQFDIKKIDNVIHHLSFPLTADQISSLNAILSDMSSTHSMYRLVQGDVGCGKTVVAALSMYACFLSGHQSALLAPTEILARQHLQSLRSILKDTGVHMEVLYSGLSAQEKERILKDIKEGDVDIVIGTHSLIQEDVIFHKLGYVVTDEQQRFGVEQRKALRKKGDNVDFLLMSATPIPRTLATALFGDMEVSTIETMPAGRIPPVTQLISENSFRSVLNDVKKILSDGHQLYVICAAVEENEDYKARDVEKTSQNLSKLFHPKRVAMLHGKMSSEEKESVMESFYKNETQVLVSTTVVEVGMNVVNATGMIIYDADRFGLSQLHQLRGRIQRGNAQGHCWLLTNNKSQDVLNRLNVLVRSNNGFEISYEDLRLRGPGDILGTRQSGIPDLILGNLEEDTNIISTARKDAENIAAHPENPDYDAITESVHKARMESSYVD